MSLDLLLHYRTESLAWIKLGTYSKQQRWSDTMKHKSWANCQKWHWCWNRHVSCVCLSDAQRFTPKAVPDTHVLLSGFFFDLEQLQRPLIKAMQSLRPANLQYHIQYPWYVTGWILGNQQFFPIILTLVLSHQCRPQKATTIAREITKINWEGE